jgi:hypothetical protein
MIVEKKEQDALDNEKVSHQEKYGLFYRQAERVKSERVVV